MRRDGDRGWLATSNDAHLTPLTSLPLPPAPLHFLLPPHATFCSASRDTQGDQRCRDHAGTPTFECLLQTNPLPCVSLSPPPPPPPALPPALPLCNASRRYALSRVPDSLMLTFADGHWQSMLDAHVLRPGETRARRCSSRSTSVGRPRCMSLPRHCHVTARLPVLGMRPSTPNPRAVCWKGPGQCGSGGLLLGVRSCCLPLSCPSTASSMRSRRHLFLSYIWRRWSVVGLPLIIACSPPPPFNCLAFQLAGTPRGSASTSATLTRSASTRSKSACKPP